MKRIPRTLALAAALAVAVPLAPSTPAQQSQVPPYRDGDRSLTALNILPPGQGRYLNVFETLESQSGGAQPSMNTDQIELYEAMVQVAPEVTEADLTELFKDASFGVRPEDVTAEYSPHPGVSVLRDRFGVPHVYGETRPDVMFGAGYVAAEDRLFMMDVLRHVGRGRLSELLGASDANLATDRAQRMVADYSEEDLLAMAERVRNLDPVLGPQFEQDATSYASGVNAFIGDALADPRKLPAEYPALQVVPEQWKITDSIAVASLIGASLGVGGGQELENAAFLEALEASGHAPEDARRIYEDLRFREDPEAPTTVDEAFPWLSDLPPADPSTVAIPDDAGAVLQQARTASPPAHIDGPFGPIRLAFPEGASNALLVGRELSSSGRPIAVFGPQTGYWSPEILMEIDMHGPGVHGRGAAFPGISLYVLLGRGEDYAWSATSAGADQVDVFAVELCDPPGTASDGYRETTGACEPLQDTTISYLAKPSAGGMPSGPDPAKVLVEIPTERAGDLGIVQARGTVDGTPVAFVRRRASYLGEVDSGLTYVEIMDPDRIDGAADFQRAFGRFNFTFNWFYLDGRDIAYQLGGDHPLRAPGTDPDFPIWYRADTDWLGMLSFEDTPKATSPERGYITSWNNKQAPGFAAADNEWSYGPVHRSQPLDERILAAAAADEEVDLVELVNAMGDAATVDLRGDQVLPLMLQVVGPGDTPEQEAALAKLRGWAESGAHRRDRDGDGVYEHHDAVEIMDEWWGRALEAVFADDLGAAFDDLPLGHDDAPGPTGSAYIAGWYGQLQKDLRQVLGLPVAEPYSRTYCGGGDLAACRAALLESLAAAVAAHETAPQVTAEERDQIRYTTLGVQGQRPMPWQNRPTFQQVLEFLPPD